MPIRYLGRQIRRFNNMCNNGTPRGNFWKTVRNSSLSYTGIKFCGYTASAFTGNRDLEQLADMAAPVASGLYAMKQTGTFSSGFTQDALIVAIAGAMGADLAAAMYDYHGSTDALRMLRDNYSRVHATIANKVTHWHDPASSGASLGVASGILALLFKGYHN